MTSLLASIFGFPFRLLIKLKNIFWFSPAKKQNTISSGTVKHKCSSACEEAFSARNYVTNAEVPDLSTYERLFEGNAKFIAAKLNEDPEYFSRRATGQSPKYLFIGCSDSRVPPDQLTGTQPGEMFIHRNVANVIVSTDMNSMSVIQYAIEVLKVKHVILMGHYNCGGVKASMTGNHLGLIDTWIRNIKDVQRSNKETLDKITDEEEKFKALVELNAKEQAMNIIKTSYVQNAWAKGQELYIHAWVYDIYSGRIKDLEVGSHWKKIEETYKYDAPK